MPRETLNTRVTRLEEAMVRAFDGIEKLDNVMVTLAEAQIKTEERIKALVEEGIRHREEMRHIEARLDERIEKLVSAIGEWMARNGKK